VKGSGYCASRSRASYLALGALCGNLTSCWKTMNLKHTENNNSWQPEDKFNQMRMMLVRKARLNEIGSWYLLCFIFWFWFCLWFSHCCVLYFTVKIKRGDQNKREYQLPNKRDSDVVGQKPNYFDLSHLILLWYDTKHPPMFLSHSASSWSFKQCLS